MSTAVPVPPDSLGGRRVVRVRQGTTTTRIAAMGGLAALGVLATLPAWGNAGSMKLLIELLTLLAMAQMWNLLAGYAGLVSIGQQAFVGIGAYGLVVFADLLKLPVLPAIGLTAVVAGGIALATSVFAFRLAGGYFAVGTWVIAEIIRLVVGQAKSVGAGTGTTLHAVSSMTVLDRQALTYWLALAVGFGSVAVVALIMRSRIGLALAAVRDSEVAAASVGVNVFRVKLFVFVVAGIGCAIAGSVIYLQLLRIQPTAAFGVDWTAKMIFIVIIGGLGRIEGPIIGVIVFFLLQETLADYGAIYLILLGAVAITVTLLAPHGLWGMLSTRFRLSLFGVHRTIIVSDPAPGAAPGGPLAT